MFEENQEPEAFGLEDFEDKNTLSGCIEGSKTRNNLQRTYLQIKKQEVTYESQLK